MNPDRIGSRLTPPVDVAKAPKGAFPASLVLTPVSRWPTTLPEATVRTVLEAPLPASSSWTVDGNPHLRIWPGVQRIFTSDIWGLTTYPARSNYYRPMFFLGNWFTAHAISASPRPTRAASRSLSLTAADQSPKSRSRSRSGWPPR